MDNLLEIRGKKAAADIKSFSYLTIQDDDGGTVRLLVGIVAGAEPGPVLCITGGMYGTIYTGIDACIRIHNELNPKNLKGTVVTVPVVEMTAGREDGESSRDRLLHDN